MSRALAASAFLFDLRTEGWSAGRDRPSALYATAKRTIDLVCSVVLLVLLAPIMAVTFLVLVVTTRGRPLFVQERVGKDRRPFRILKFRTMVTDAEKLKDQTHNEQSGPVFKNRRDPRITRVGRLLRSTSIDEFPQLLNVLAGQMSLVGPRPPLASEVKQYEPWQLVRLTVKPGLTCLWQVSGRSNLAFHEWMRMDAWYVRNRSLLVDLWLMLKTPACVLSRRGAY